MWVCKTGRVSSKHKRDKKTKKAYSGMPKSERPNNAKNRTIASSVSRRSDFGPFGLKFSS